MNEQERIQTLLKQENMTAKDFSREIGISQATMSNILSGRNNPSLEVMQKVLARFRTLNTDWLILGVGSMYKQKNQPSEPLLFDMRPADPVPAPSAFPMPAPSASTSSAMSAAPTPANASNLSATSAPHSIPTEPRKQSAISPQPQIIVEKPAPKHISKIVVFYDDGSYEEK